MTGVRADPPADRFGLVFVLLTASFVFGAVVTDPRGQTLVLVACVAALLVVLRVTAVGRGRWPLLRAVLSVVSAVAVAVALALPGDTTAAVAAAWLAVVVAATILAILRRLLSHPTVTVQTILGGLSAYVLIGFLFTALYSAVAHLGPGFFAGGQPANSSTLQYFSFVTMTTTGYGDLTPVGSGPRSLAVLEALLGQIFLVTLVARLVAMFGRRLPTRPYPPARRTGADVPAAER